jgi:septal ring factor EnvC (AmiA/AmiB activator)
MTRKQQLASAAAGSEPLRRDNQQLRTTLACMQTELSTLQQRLAEEERARQTAVRAKADVERQLAEMQTSKENAEVGRGFQFQTLQPSFCSIESISETVQSTQRATVAVLLLCAQLQAVCCCAALVLLCSDAG